MTRPTYVQAHLEAQGLADGRVTVNARPNRCPRCRTRTLAGIDDLGGTIHVQPEPTTTLGELTALLAGQRTWTVLGGYLVHRGADRINRADANAEASHPEHRCGSPPQPANPARAIKAYRPDYNADPPY